MRVKILNLNTLSLACLMAALLPSSVLAADDSNSTPVEEVVISASRVTSRPGYEAPTPTTVLDSEFIADMGTPNIADALNRMPAMGSGNSPRSNRNNTSNPTQGANFLNLRGLGTNRSLILLDGRRVAAAAVTGQVDMNLMPTTLLKRTDIVTGGASAAWGSDAVAGVVNLVLDNKYTGIKTSIQGGTSAESDGDEEKFNIAGGFEFAEGRGHVLASVNYTKTDTITAASSRDWYKATKLVNNPDFAPGNGEPQRLVLDGIGNFIGSDEGHTFLGPPPQAMLAGITFAPDGSLLPFDFGTRFPNGALSTSINGDGELNDFAGRSALSIGYEQINTFLRGSYDVTDNVNVYGEYIYGNTEAESRTVPYYRLGGSGPRIQRDNAFLPAELGTMMDGVGATSVQIVRSNVDFGRANPYNDRDFSRFVIGADLNLNDNWSLETYYQHGETDLRAEVRSDADTAKYALAIDAVDDGSGNIVCRSTLADPTNGCVPADIFTAPSQAAIDYVMGTAIQDTTITQDVFAITATGDLFALPAGPVSTAFGYEHRKEEFSTSADDVSLVNGWWTGNYKNAAGEYDVNEVFGEVVVPVFADSPMGESLDLNAALRFTDYSTSGQVETWKVGFTYDIGAGVSLRGTISEDIRAPNLDEYFSGGATVSTFFDDSAVNPGDTNVLVPQTTRGNPDLNPEVASSNAFGIVYQPEFLEGLVVSVDYFDINIEDAISSVADQDILDRCAGGEDAFCSLAVRDGSGTLLQVFNGPVNFAEEQLSGYDIEASYSFEAAGGNVDIRTLWTYTKEHFTVDRGLKDDLLGEFSTGGGAFAGGPQEVVGLTSIRYSTDNLALSLRNRYIGDGVIDAEWTSGVDVDDNKIDSVTYFDVTAAYTFFRGDLRFEVFGSIDNLFDKDPPVAVFDGRTALDHVGVESRHDVIGRYFRVGLRASF